MCLFCLSLCESWGALWDAFWESFGVLWDTLGALGETLLGTLGSLGTKNLPLASPGELSWTICVLLGVQILVFQLSPGNPCLSLSSVSVLWRISWESVGNPFRMIIESGRISRNLWRISGESLGNPFGILVESWGNL